jgi:hypothetical protein
MSALGTQQIDAATEMQNEFSRLVCLHQAPHGLGASVENPEGACSSNSLSGLTPVGSHVALKDDGDSTSLTAVK